MQRFTKGEQVLVSRVMGSSCEPPRIAIVSEVYPRGHGKLYDYMVLTDSSSYPVRDEWLAPMTIMITEDPDWVDVC